MSIQAALAPGDDMMWLSRHLNGGHVSLEVDSVPAYRASYPVWIGFMLLIVCNYSDICWCITVWNCVFSSKCTCVGPLDGVGWVGTAVESLEQSSKFFVHCQGPPWP